MEDDTHQPDELNSQMRVMETYLKARYRLSHLLRAQRNDHMTSNLERWIENGAPDKGNLEEDSCRILRKYFVQKEGRFYLNKDGTVVCKRREEDRVLYKNNAIVLPQFYQTELLFRSHDQMDHQGINKVYQRILKRFEWPGMKKPCDKCVTACLSCQQVKDPRKLLFPLQSIESSEFSEVVQIDHQKISMTDSSYNQVLVMIDYFTKYAEAMPCINSSAEETCDHLINTWIARHGCPMIFQSHNGTAFVGELTKELIRHSQVAQAHSTTYHPQTYGLVERQNRTLVSMLRVYCSRYMTDWDRYLPQVIGAYNSTQHSTTGVSTHMMLTGHKKSLPMTFFYPEYEAKKTSPQVYVRDVIRRQQELNDLCRRNTQQAQARQRKRFDKKAAGAKTYSVGDCVWVFQNVIPPKEMKKLIKKEACRRSVLHLNLISAVDGSTLNWCEKHALRELISEDLLFAKISEPDMNVITTSETGLGNRRGHIEVFPKLCNLRSYDKTNGEVTRTPRLTAAYHKLREETKGWGDYKKLPEEILEFPLIRRILLGADTPLG